MVDVITMSDDLFESARLHPSLTTPPSFAKARPSECTALTLAAGFIRRVMLGIFATKLGGIMPNKMSELRDISSTEEFMDLCTTRAFIQLSYPRKAPIRTDVTVRSVADHTGFSRINAYSYRFGARCIFVLSVAGG